MIIFKEQTESYFSHMHFFILCNKEIMENDTKTIAFNACDAIIATEAKHKTWTLISCIILFKLLLDSANRQIAFC